MSIRDKIIDECAQLLNKSTAHFWGKEIGKAENNRRESLQPRRGLRQRVQELFRRRRREMRSERRPIVDLNQRQNTRRFLQLGMGRHAERQIPAGIRRRHPRHKRRSSIRAVLRRKKASGIQTRKIIIERNPSARSHHEANHKLPNAHNEP